MKINQITIKDFKALKDILDSLVLLQNEKGNLRFGHNHHRVGQQYQNQ